MAWRFNSVRPTGSRPLKRWLAAAVFTLWMSASQADVVYQSKQDFIRSSLNLVPKPSVIWLDKRIQDKLRAILGHAYPQARLRFWQANHTRVWILNEIGKEYPITAGFVIRDHQIKQAKVLIYRETRGIEIHLPQYLAQFDNNFLAGNQLAKHVDGITGATLSSNAMIKMARGALLLDTLVHDKAQH